MKALVQWHKDSCRGRAKGAPNRDSLRGPHAASRGESGRCLPLGSVILIDVQLILRQETTLVNLYRSSIKHSEGEEGQQRAEEGQTKVIVGSSFFRPFGKRLHSKSSRVLHDFCLPVKADRVILKSFMRIKHVCVLRDDRFYGSQMFHRRTTEPLSLLDLRVDFAMALLPN